MTITLTRHEPVGQQTTEGLTALWYLLVTAAVAGADSQDSRIFVYQRSGDPALGDRFVAVASAAAMRDMPAAPNESPYYRHDRAEFLCRSAAELDEVWQALQDDALLLANDWSKLSSASTGVTATITSGQTPVGSIATEVSRSVRAVFSDDFSRVEFYNDAGVKVGEQLLTRSE